MGNKKLFLLHLMAFLNLISYAQEETTRRDNAIRIFLDCNYCDNEHIKKEFTLVNYVRDRKDAQVHVLVTTETTGAGGRKQTFYFIGQHEFTSQADTLNFTVKADATDDEIRSKQLHILKLGLTRYIAKTPFAEKLMISFHRDGPDEIVTDKWNSWFFELNSSAYFNGEQSYKYLNLWASTSAQRITEDLKVGFWANYGYSENTFTLPDTTIVSTYNNSSFHHLMARSLNDHWSAGYFITMRRSLFQNLDLSMMFYPSIEFNIFPYSQSNRKQLRILYGVGPRYFDYIEISTYDQLRELRFGQRLGISGSFMEKWGSISTSLEGSHYFHDISLKRLDLRSTLRLRIYKGLSMSLYGNFSMIHDQINLPKGNISNEDMLLRRKQIKSAYDYWGSVGISYSFGSIYNNVVNPRFGD